MTKWIEPRVWQSGEYVTAAALNTLGDQLEYLKARDRVHCYGPLQEIGNERWVRLKWSDEKFDNNEMHSRRRRPHLVHIRRDGFYLVLCKVNFAVNTTGYRAVMLRRNSGGEESGGQRLGTWNTTGIDTDQTTVFARELVRLDRGDDVCAFAYQNSGAALDVKSDASHESFLQVLQVASIP